MVQRRSAQHFHVRRKELRLVLPGPVFIRPEQLAEPVATQHHQSGDSELHPAMVEAAHMERALRRHGGSGHRWQPHRRVDRVGS